MTSKRIYQVNKIHYVHKRGIERVCYDDLMENELPNSHDDFEPDHVRRKYLYRRLAMNGKTKMPIRLAMKLVGPDCAYHLYSNHMPDNKSEPSDEKQKKP